MRFTAVLFDLDGTLLDTLDDLGDSMNAVLASRGLAVHGMEEYKYFVGDGVQNLVLRALPASLRSEAETVRSCVVDMRAEYSRRWKDKTRLYDGIGDLLDELTKRGARMAILSNKPHPALMEVVGHFFPRWNFEAAIGARPAFPQKPDPAPALEVARSLGIMPERFLYLGDTNTDMQTAVSAGMFPVGALWGFRTAEELKQSGALALVANPREVLELL
jgi:phosphoglycolate phosphatase